MGDISRLSLPWMQPNVCSSSELVIFTPCSLDLRRARLAFCSCRYSSRPSRLPLNFRFDISTSLRCALCDDSWWRIPMSVTFPAPAFSLYSWQHHRTFIVGMICRATAVWYMLRCGFMSCTSGYCVLTNRMTYGGSTDVRFMWAWNLTPASCAMWYRHCESFPPENAR